MAEAVAPLGTALTERQLEGLWRLAEEPVLCFDGDEAGARAAARAVERALPGLQPPRSLRFASLPAGQDPDTMVRDRGRRAMEEIIDAAIPLSRQLWEMAVGGRALDTPEARARVNKQLRDTVGPIPDPDLRRDYLEQFRKQLWPQAQERRRDAGRPAHAAEPKVSRSAVLGPGGGGTAQPRERTLLQTLLAFPALMLEQSEAVAGFPFETARYERVAAAAVDWAEAGPGPEDAGLRAFLVERGFANVVEELAGDEAHYLDRPESMESALVLFETILKRQRQHVEERAAQSEAEGAHTDEAAWERARERILRLQEAAEKDADLPDLGAAPPTGGA